MLPDCILELRNQDVELELQGPLFRSTRPPSPAQSDALAAVMPALAGRPLEGPRFHKTQWQSGQVFSESDDPDRTAEPWPVPQFITSGGPGSGVTKVEELALGRATMSGRFARVVRGVLTQEQCAELLAHVNSKGFTPALLNIGHGRQKLEPFVRDGHRIIVDSPELAAWLLEALRPHLPETMAGGHLVGLNERCRFLCYTPGQCFEEHLDGCYVRPRGHPCAGDRSWITVQLYLHDVPAAHGGATTFFPGRTYGVGHQPEAGSALLFTQDLTHEGSLVKAGLKYTMRTEVMYAKPAAAQPQESESD